ncbi:hypothetical protein GGF46_003128 [Coemansia sp. RSA 552]|nr:hypothetical protein GGF46_003128 [Coemansia sp. RSA 552]
MSRIPVTPAPSLLPKLGLRGSGVAGRGGDTYVYETICMDSGAVAASTSERKVHIYERFGTDPVRTIQYHSEQLTQIRTREDSLLSSSRDGKIAIWDLRQAGSTPAHVFRSEDPVLSFDLSADKTMLIGGSQLNSSYMAKIQFWDPRAPGAPVTAFEGSHSDDVTQIHCNWTAPKKFLSGSTDGLLCTFDMSQPEEDDALEYVANTNASIAQCGYFGPESQFIYAQSDMDTLQLWTDEATQLADFGDVRDLTQGGVPVDYIVNCKYDADAQRLYMVGGNNDGQIQLLHVGAASMEHAQTLDSGHSDVVRGFGWDLPGGWAVSGGEDGRVAWWSTPQDAEPAKASPGAMAVPRRPNGQGTPSRRFAPY